MSSKQLQEQAICSMVIGTSHHYHCRSPPPLLLNRGRVRNSFAVAVGAPSTPARSRQPSLHTSLANPSSTQNPLPSPVRTARGLSPNTNRRAAASYETQASSSQEPALHTPSIIPNPHQCTQEPGSESTCHILAHRRMYPASNTLDSLHSTSSTSSTGCPLHSSLPTRPLHSKIKRPVARADGFRPGSSSRVCTFA